MWFALKFIAIIAGLFLLSACVAPSSENVRVIGDNVVRVPSGEMASFSKYVGKSHYEWQVNYDGSVVHSDCSPMCKDEDVHIADVGEPIKVNTNGFGTGQFTATKQSDGSIHLAWPYGITFHGP